jgi:hypothetical protein
VASPAEAAAEVASPTSGSTLAQKRRLREEDCVDSGAAVKLRIGDAGVVKSVAVEEAALVVEDSASG